MKIFLDSLRMKDEKSASLPPFKREGITRL